MFSIILYTCDKYILIISFTEKRIGSRQVTQDPEIAFFASISTNIEHLGGGQIIVFDNVVTKVDSSNSLGGYNHVTGVFTAPVDGLYVFSTTLMSHENAYAHFRIYRDNTPVAAVAVSGTLHKYYSASATVVLLLSKGETVSVRHHESEDSALEGAFVSSGQSMFSGFLLQLHNRVAPFIG